MKVRFLLPAQDELDEAVREYANRRSGLGRKFHDAVMATSHVIADFPDAWHPLGNGYRRAAVQGFPYALIYAQQSEHILVVAVAHARRRVNYWHGRR